MNNPFSFAEERNSISSAVIAATTQHRMPAISSRGTRANMNDSMYKAKKEANTHVNATKGFIPTKLAQDSTQSGVIEGPFNETPHR